MATSFPSYHTQYTISHSPLRHSNTPPLSRFNMLDGLKKRLSKRKSSNVDSSSWSYTAATADAAKTSSTRDGNLSPPDSNNPFRSPSPATRRPSNTNVNASTAPREAPPAYTPGPAQQDNTAVQFASASTDTDRYAFLKSFDTIFLIDDSGSMAGRSWKETGKALEAIAPICAQRDADGIDIYFLNHPDSSLYKNVTSAGTIIEIFQSVRPSGATPTGQRLNKILRPYLRNYEKNPDTTKPVNIIVITDGEPSDDVESPIIQAAKKLDRLDAPAWQVGIQFFQVGKEPGAREHLKQLDDGLRELAGDEDLRDMVDTVPFTGDNNAGLTAEGLLKVVLGSVNRKLDRSSKELHRK